MLERIIYISIQHRWIVLFFVIGLMALGVRNFQKLPIDAVPDITNVQVQINTQAQGYSPLEVEQRITFPIETALSGIPKLDYTRSLSRYGLSQVTIVFEVGHSSSTKLALFDAFGREVKTIEWPYLEAGEHRIQWDLGHLPNGNYFLHFADEQRKSTRILRIVR